MDDFHGRQPEVERRLTAILAADVVGYSRLMEADGAHTHARLKAVRKEFIEDEDIYGDGVNVAARGRSRRAGGILISRIVRDNVQDKLAYRFEDIGEREVKNITRPLHVFWVLPGCAATPAATGSHPTLLMCTCAAPTSTRGGCQPPATGS